MPFSDDKIILYMTINAVGLLILFFHDKNMRPTGNKKLDTIGTICRVTMYLNVWGMIGSFPFDLFDDPMSLATIAHYANCAALLISHIAYFRMKRDLSNQDSPVTADSMHDRHQCYPR